MTEPTLTLYSEDLFSKWGFHDGDMPDHIVDYLLDTEDTDTIANINWHDALTAMVRRYLLPALNSCVEVEVLITLHNPIRATAVDGIPVPRSTLYGRRPPPPTLDPEWVEVTVPWSAIRYACAIPTS